VFADAVYDFGYSAGTFVLGPELGYAFFGLDGGVGLRLGLENDPEIGWHVRGLIAAGAVSLFGRYGYWPDSTIGTHIVQIGILIKMPFWNGTVPEAVAR
jgi:hypothetical protein